MLSNKMLAHSSNDHKLLFTFAQSLLLTNECADVLLKRAFEFVRVCECMLSVVVAVLCGMRDDVAVDERILSANVVRSGGGGGACTKRAVFACVRWFVVVLVRALFLALSYFSRNGQLISFALCACGNFALLQLKHE